MHEFQLDMPVLAESGPSCLQLLRSSKRCVRFAAAPEGPGRHADNRALRIESLRPDFKR